MHKQFGLALVVILTAPLAFAIGYFWQPAPLPALPSLPAPPPPPPAPRNWTVRLPPDYGEDLAVEALTQARREVRVRADDVAGVAVAQALVDAKARGRDVAVLLCRRDGPGPSSQLPFLAREKVKVTVSGKATSARHCYAVVDQELVVLGGLSGEDGDDGCLVVRDAALAGRYLADWQRRQDRLTAALGLN